MKPEKEKNATSRRKLKKITEISEINLSIKQDYCMSVSADDCVIGTLFVHPLEAIENMKKKYETDLQTLNIRQH